MLETIKDALSTVQQELTTSVQKLRGVPPSGSQNEVMEAVASLLETQAGSSLLSKYQLYIEQIEQMNDENIRAANLTSTRLGTVQQMCNERAQCVIAINEHFRSVGEISKQLKDLSHHIEKVKRFCIQTEQAITYLEALQIVADSEKKIEVLKHDLKIEKEEVKRKSELRRNWIQSTSSPVVRFTPAPSGNEETEEGPNKNHSEVTILEKFLSS